MPIILSIDMSDPSGGTGVNAATKTVHALGGYACTAVTAISVQTPDEVICVEAVSAELVKKQIEHIHKTWPIDAVVIGVIPNVEIAEVIANFLDEHHTENMFVVLDPVMINQLGYQFLSTEVIAFMKRRLLLHADMVTPNVYEIEHLTGVELSTREEAEQAAEMLMTFGCRSVLIKGERQTKDSVQDLYLDEEKFYVIETPFFEMKKVHGAGVTLASAIAVSVAMGVDALDAVSGARSYLAQVIERSPDKQDDEHFVVLEHFI